jgi:SAM-dependent methyltransferase
LNEREPRDRNERVPGDRGERLPGSKEERVPHYRLAFLSEGRPLQYGDRLARWRWQRAYAPSSPAVDLAPEAPARESLAGADVWLLVTDPTAVPLDMGSLPDPVAGTVRVATGAVSPPPAAHTLREIEESRLRPGEGSADGVRCPAALFRPSDFPPAPGETVAAYFDRLSRDPLARVIDSRLGALALEDPFRRERPEVTRHIPRTTRRLLDVGCGAGGASRALRSAIPDLHATGIESDPTAADRAREALDVLLEGDAQEMLSRLVGARSRFDGFLFADVLEHLEDPVGALAKARALAEDGAILAASVPNAGHISLVRDLLLGRFDPVPAGLEDAGHLRWFSRSFLSEALEEAGWTVVAIESIAGAPAPAAEEFQEWLTGWPEADRESLSTYQWIAVARAAGSTEE